MTLVPSRSTLDCGQRRDDGRTGRGRDRASAVGGPPRRCAPIRARRTALPSRGAGSSACWSSEPPFRCRVGKHAPLWMHCRAVGVTSRELMWEWRDAVEGAEVGGRGAGDTWWHDLWCRVLWCQVHCVDTRSIVTEGIPDWTRPNDSGVITLRLLASLYRHGDTEPAAAQVRLVHRCCTVSTNGTVTPSTTRCGIDSVRGGVLVRVLPAPSRSRPAARRATRVGAGRPGGRTTTGPRCGCGRCPRRSARRAPCARRCAGGS